MLKFVQSNSSHQKLQTYKNYYFQSNFFLLSLFFHSLSLWSRNFFFQFKFNIFIFFLFVSSVNILLNKSIIFLCFALTSPRIIKTSFRFVKILLRFYFIFVKRLRKWAILRFARLIANWILYIMSKIYFSTRHHYFIKIINLIFRFFTLTKIERLLLTAFWRSRFTYFVKFR